MSKQQGNKFAALEELAVGQVREVGAPTSTPVRASAETEEAERERRSRRAISDSKRSRADKTNDTADMIQTSVYLTKDTHKRVKAALILDDGKEDLSDLVERLLVEWLHSR
jgi:hypothetical protein